MTHRTILNILHSSFTDTQHLLRCTQVLFRIKKSAFSNYLHLFKKQSLSNEPLTLTSSQDILYSAKTVRHRAAILCGLCQGKQLTLVHRVNKNWKSIISIGFNNSSNYTSFKLTNMIEGYIDGATTLLCIPAKNKPIRVIQLMVKNGWFQSDVKNDT